MFFLINLLFYPHIPCLRTSMLNSIHDVCTILKYTKTLGHKRNKRNMYACILDMVTGPKTSLYPHAHFYFSESLFCIVIIVIVVVYYSVTINC